MDALDSLGRFVEKVGFDRALILFLVAAVVYLQRKLDHAHALLRRGAIAVKKHLRGRRRARRSSR